MMAIILWGIAIFSVLLAVYVVWFRPWLREKPWARRFFAAIEPIEIIGWKKSETIFKARAKMVIGLLLTGLTQLGGLDLTPIMPLVPDAYEPAVKVAFNLLPLIITIGGWVDEKLREDTTKPLELVAIAEADKTPAVEVALALANATKIEAVAVVKAEKELA